MAKKRKPKKPPRGRPLLSDRDRRSLYMAVRFSPTEIEATKRAASKAGMVWSSWVRMHLGVE